MLGGKRFAVNKRRGEGKGPPERPPLLATVRTAELELSRHGNTLEGDRAEFCDEFTEAK